MVPVCFDSTFEAHEAVVGSEMAGGKLGDVTWASSGSISAIQAYTQPAIP